MAIAKHEDSPWEGFGKLAGFCVYMVANVLVYARVIAQLWAWFIVPAFHVAPLSLITAAGIDLLSSALRPPTSEPDMKDKELGELIGIMVKRLWIPVFILGIAWTVHLFA